MPRSFAPILPQHPKVLILGSMPGKASLAKTQYYAHPQNCFWYMLKPVIGVAETESYQTRVAGLESLGIAVWDVLSTCQRTGSLDANIVRGSESFNDLAGLFERFPSVKNVLFNGQTAAKLFAQLFKSSTHRHTLPSLHTMPSTSPAHASVTRARKRQIWLAALTSGLA